MSSINTRALPTALLILGMGLISMPCQAESDEELAKKLANPISSLISVPIKYSYDKDIGSANGHRSVLIIQPVIPIELNKDWNIISRTIVPTIDQHDVAGRSGDQSGVGDVTQSLFFSPKQPTKGGVVWGVGPVFQLRTASKPMLGAEKWGLGPTAIALVQTGPWTYGALANHIRSVGGDSNRADIKSTYLQPFLAFTTKGKATYTLNSESTYDHRTGKWAVPLNLTASQLFRVGQQPMSLAATARYWAQSPATGAQGWGFSLQWTLLFPK